MGAAHPATAETTNVEMQMWSDLIIIKSRRVDEAIQSCKRYQANSDVGAIILLRKPLLAALVDVSHQHVALIVQALLHSGGHSFTIALDLSPIAKMTASR